MIIGSFANNSIALSGAGWKSKSICSKRGFEPGAGRGFWLVDHRSAKFGAWGTTVWVVLEFVSTTGGRGVDFSADDDEDKEAEVVVSERWRDRRPMASVLSRSIVGSVT